MEEKKCISIRPPFLPALLVPLTLLASNYLGETWQNWPLHPYRKPDEKSFTRSNRANFPNFPFKRLFSRVTRHPRRPKPPFKIVTERSRTVFHPFRHRYSIPSFAHTPSLPPFSSTESIPIVRHAKKKGSSFPPFDLSFYLPPPPSSSFHPAPLILPQFLRLLSPVIYIRSLSNRYFSRSPLSVLPRQEWKPVQSAPYTRL